MENNVEQLHRFNQPKLLANGKKLVSVQSLIATGHQDFPLTSLLTCDYGFHSFIPLSHALLQRITTYNIRCRLNTREVPIKSKTEPLVFKLCDDNTKHKESA